MLWLQVQKRFQVQTLLYKQQLGALFLLQQRLLRQQWQWILLRFWLLDRVPKFRGYSWQWTNRIVSTIKRKRKRKKDPHKYSAASYETEMWSYIDWAQCRVVVLERCHTIPAKILMTICAFYTRTSFNFFNFHSTSWTWLQITKICPTRKWFLKKQRIIINKMNVVIKIINWPCHSEISTTTQMNCVPLLPTLVAPILDTFRTSHPNFASPYKFVVNTR